ncbi:MAG: lipase maturation factor family protein [Thermoanaerobaculia bacterium]
MSASGEPEKRTCPSFSRPTWRLGTALFVRGLGLIYLVSFASLWVQVDGLVGAQGILPIGELLARASEVLGPERYWRLPTLVWLAPGDGTLHVLCALGCALGVALALGWFPLAMLAALWVLELSMVTAGQTFFAFQWDNLLLEAGFLALLVAPPTLRLRLSDPPEPPRWGRWLLWWLVVRLHVSSGWVKLASGDPSWRHLTALTVHYENQPLPTWIGWLAHQLPAWWQRVSAAVMFAIELAVPWLAFTTVRLRRSAAIALVGLQLAIGATGNYTFFNCLTILLCVTLLDDGFWPARLAPAPPRPASRSRLRGGSVAAAAALLGALSLVSFLTTLGLGSVVPGPLQRGLDAVRPLRTVNGYGLFAVMTTERPEIVVEGSLDGADWRPYPFRWKPGPLDRRPRFVAPHQPRLDWQMWFAALGGYRSTPWMPRFLERLLEADPAVLDLLAADPFAGARPRFVRARLYRYRFTDWEALRREGRWWSRELLGIYAPEVSLAEPEPASGAR